MMNSLPVRGGLRNSWNVTSSPWGEELHWGKSYHGTTFWRSFLTWWGWGKCATSTSTPCHQLGTWRKPLYGLTCLVIPQWPELVSVPSQFVLQDTKGAFHCDSHGNGRWEEAWTLCSFQRVRLIVELMQCPSVVVMMSRNRWMNEDLTVEYLDRVWGRLTFYADFYSGMPTGLWMKWENSTQ